MKYKVNRVLCHYTTEDGRYTIKKNWRTGTYQIYDNQEHKYIRSDDDRMNAVYGRLKYAKAHVERLYQE